MDDAYIIGSINLTDVTTVRVVSTELNFQDFLGAIMVRWGINRNRYRVEPGLYAVGSPDSSSDVFVTANYKLSFDNLRKNLQDINGWILVLDTKGINVWCAAGKGTFGTKELIKRLRGVSLERIVKHKRLILPQLGATGVAAHKVKDETGFIIHYGPIRASDIKKFLNAGYRADKEMRKIKFGLGDRLKLIPNDMVYGKFYLLGALVLFVLLSFVSKEGISVSSFRTEGIRAIAIVILAYFSGIVLTPLFLPVLPARLFSLKGFYTGSLTFFILWLFNLTGDNIYELISWFLLVTALSSFLAMNFTGSSTYTSLSGVKKEMKFSLPLQIGFSLVSVVMQIIGKLI